MRRPFLKNKALISTLFILAVFLMTPHFAHAGWVEELVTGGIGMILEILILPLASAVLALGGLLLDMAINFSLHTAYIFSLSPAINLGWTIVRDMCNLFFIFVLIYISLGTIVRGTSFGTKDLLTKVIIAALVINFSLFVTKAVVDVSNVFGLWLYGGIQNTLQANTDPTETTGRASLSDLISARLGIINWMTGGSNATQNNSGASTDLSNPSKSFIAKILRLAIVLIATYIFFYCSVLFISRSVTLLFLMVFSPVGFMGSVLPQLKDYASDWKKELTSAAMFPIAFLLMLYISLQFINSLGVLSQAQLTDKTVIGGVSVSDYFQYALILFLLQACLSVAKDNAGKMGKAVGGLADGLGKLAVNAGVAVASGGSALALRAGAAAVFAEKGKGLDAAKSTLRSGIPLVNQFGRGKDIVKDVKKNLKEGSYDIRNAKIPGVGTSTVASTLSKMTGVTINTKTAKEYKEEKGQFDKEIKLETSILGVLEDIKNIDKARNDFSAGTITLAQMNTAVNDAQARIRGKTSKMSNQELETVTTRAHEVANKISKGNTVPAAGTTTSDVLSGFTNVLKQNQTNYIASSEMPGNIKSAVQASRQNDLDYALNPAAVHSVSRADSVKKTFSQLSPIEVSKLPLSTLQDPDVLALLRPEHLKKISEEYTYNQRDVIRAYIMSLGPGDKVKKWLEENTEGQLF